MNEPKKKKNNKYIFHFLILQETKQNVIDWNDKCTLSCCASNGFGGQPPWKERKTNTQSK